MPSPAEIARRMWPWFWTGFALVGATVINLWLAVTIYPPKFVNGVACTCGRPEWVTYWTWAIFAMPILAFVLILYGAVRDRRLYPRMARSL